MQLHEAAVRIIALLTAVVGLYRKAVGGGGVAGCADCWV